MLQSGCQGRDRTPTISEKTCPNCGAPIELFSIDTEVVCDKCGFKVYNDKIDCVQWCKYAKECVGEEAYEQLMAIARRQKEERARQKAEKAAAAVE